MKSIGRSWYLLTGLILGLGAGILIAWVFAPTQYVDTLPVSLRVDYKDEYRYLIASAYSANKDLLRAEARLGVLDEANLLQALEDQVQRMQTNNIPVNQIQVLAKLAADVKAHPPISATPTDETPLTATSTLTPDLSPTPTQALTATFTIAPTKTTTSTPAQTETPTPVNTSSPTPEDEKTATLLPKPVVTIAAQPSQTTTMTPGTPIKLIKKTTICEITQPGLLQINISDNDGKPVPAVELTITWLNGNESFFTGLKPEIGFGYADYSMAPNIEYSLSLSDGNTRITGLKTEPCTNSDGKKTDGGIRLEFRKP